MIRFREIGYSSLSLSSSITLFFAFLGHLVIDIGRLLCRRVQIKWSIFFHTLFLSGAKMMLPIIIISATLSFSLVLTLFSILNEFHMGGRALSIVQTAAISYLAPLIIGIILAIQSALNLINANIHKLPHSADEAMGNYIIPSILAILVAGFLLYIYSLVSLLVSIYLTFQYVLNVSVNAHLIHLASSISMYSLEYSLFKALIYCIIIGLIVGFYHYKIALQKITLRKAVSRIMTRSLLMIIFLSAYLNIFYV